MNLLNQDPEYQYLNLMRKIIAEGDPKMDRTKVGTKSIFGEMLKFDLSNGTVPLLTTKKIAWKAPIKEMIWFMQGETNIRSLLQQNVSIWSDWPYEIYKKSQLKQSFQHILSLKDFENEIIKNESFAQKWGELGPVYGKQWRKWEGSDGKIYDQVAEVENLLKTDPFSRRILFHAWNVPDLPEMALPPCHLVYQFQVTSNGKLNGLLYQRSCDVFLGLPYNLMSMSALMLMLANVTGRTPGMLTWMGGDTHLYNNHIKQAKLQWNRNPKGFPKLKIIQSRNTVADFKIEDFEIEDYIPHDKIQADVAV